MPHTDLWLRIVAILFPLISITALGYVVGRKKRPDMRSINQINMDIFVPALVFAALASKEGHWQSYGPLFLATLLIVVGSGLVGWALATVSGLAPKTLVPSLMFNNCGNLGLPLAVLAFGQEALAPAVVLFIPDFPLAKFPPIE